MPKLPHPKSVLLALLLLGVVGAPRLGAMGAPTLQTDDTETAGDGRWEFNLGASTERRPGSRLVEGPVLDVNYGIGDRLHLNYEVPYLQRSETGSPRLSGLGNSALGVKWRFADGGEHGLSVSVFPKVEFKTPGSSASDRGLAEPGTHYGMPLQFQRTVGPLTLVGQLGREFGGGRDGWNYGFSAGHHLSEKVEIGAELVGGASGGLHRSQLAANLGLSADLSAHFTLMLSLGRELHNHDEPRASLLAYAGIQLRR